MELHKVAIRIALNNGNDSTGGGALSDAGFVLNATAFGSALLPGRRRFGLAGWGGDLQPDIANGVAMEQTNGAAMTQANDGAIMTPV